MSTKFESIEGFDTEAAVESLEVDLLCSGQEARDYADYLEVRYAETDAFGVLDFYAKYLEFQDKLSALEGITVTERRVPFFKGALLGLRAVELSPTSWVFNELGPGTFSVKLSRSNPDEYEGEEGARSLIREVSDSLELSGDDGYGMVADFHSVIHAWGAHITGSMPAGIPFQRGFGYSLLAAKQIIDRNFTSLLEDSGLDVAAIEAEFE